MERNEAGLPDVVITEPPVFTLLTTPTEQYAIAMKEAELSDVVIADPATKVDEVTPVEVANEETNETPEDAMDNTAPTKADAAADDLEKKPVPAKPVKAKFVVFSSCFLGLLMSFQYGWATSQLNYSKFNKQKDCDHRPVKPGTCIMFPGHTKLEWTIVVNAWIVGGMLGSLFVGRIADAVGRKRALQLNCGLVIISSILMTTSYNLWQFAIGRLIAGLASGATTGCLGGYINEVAPPHLRSVLGAILQGGITIGILCVATTFFYLDFHDGWRIIAAFPIVLATMFLTLSPFVMVESPVWLLLKGRRAEAEKVVDRLFGEENHTAALAWMGAKPKHHPEVHECWSRSGHEVHRENKGLPLSELVKPALRRQFVIGLGLATMQKLTGINTIFYYSSDLFSRAGLKNGRVATIIIDVVSAVPTVTSGFFSKSFGSRTMLLASLSGMLTSAILLTISLTYDIAWLTILAASTFVAAFGIGLGPLLWVVLADITPDYARATVTSIDVMVAWLANLVVGIGYPYASTALDNLAYTPFIAIITASWIFVYFLVPETAGKTTEEIQEHFRKLRNKNAAVVARS